MRFKRPFAPFFVLWYCRDVVLDVLKRCDVPLGGKRLLEAGCGGGGMLFRLNRYASHVTGLDVSQATVDFLRDRYVPNFDNVDVVACDMCSYEPDTPHDMVISNDCFEHVADQDSFLRGVARCLRPAGVLLLQFPNDTGHGVCRHETLRQLRALVDKCFGAARYFCIQPSGYHRLLRRAFELIRAKAAPEHEKIRQAVLNDPETHGLDDFARSSCFRYMQEEAGGGAKFLCARLLNGFFRFLDRIGPGHRTVEITNYPSSEEILGRRLVVVARRPKRPSEDHGRKPSGE